MLKALELAGFKSFADRTRFDFPDGITVIVGPNGSGKSNVVDAIKWVLGAQSAKALRGSDMTDVIFKGSAEGGRKPANSAEVSLVLDNRTRLLPIDSDEVQVGRRVFRSGEGEYSINGRPCRLKDVRELFRGTGVGFDAYSLIEQGKVDRLLQSSAKDRRAIFEEAAGISRFKARKVEAERRLARVDQNMIRLRDIVDEVGGRLNTLKTQATRAQRYRELSSQMLAQRRQLGILERIELVKHQTRIEQESQHAIAQTGQIQEQLRTIEEELANAEERQRERQRDLDGQQQEIVGLQTSLAQLQAELTASRQRHSEWTAEQGNLQDRIESLQRRVSISEEEISDRRNELDQLAIEKKQLAERVEAIEAECREHDARVDAARESLEQRRLEQQNLRDELSKSRYEISLQEAQLEQVAAAIDRLKLDSSLLQQQLDLARYEIGKCIEEKEEVEQQQIQAIANKETAKQQQQEVIARLDEQRQRMLELQSQLQGLRERKKVLEQLEDQFATAGKGGQQLIRAAHALVESQRSGNRYSIDTHRFERATTSIRGIVADLITSELHLAPLVDVALGSHSDAVVLADGQIIDWIQEGRLLPEGRVTLLRLDRLPARRTGEKIQLDGLRGVLGRADRLVQFDPSHEPLVRSLLGTTWFVESLTTALELSHLRGAGLRFVTAECQLVDSDGSITIGSLQAGLGLVSRRSEMQATQEQIEHIRQQHLSAKSDVEQTQAESVEGSERVQSAEQEVYRTERSAATIHERISAIHQRADQLQRDADNKQMELAEKLAAEAALQSFISQQRIQLDELLLTSEQIQRQCSQQEKEFETLESSSHDLQDELIEKRVDVARIEQRIDGLKTTLDQLLNDTNERTNHVQAAQDGLLTLSSKLEEISQVIESIKQRISDEDQRLGVLQQARTDAVSQVENHQFALQTISRNRDNLQRQLDKWTDRHAASQQEGTRISEELGALTLRYRNEYQIELEAIESEEVDEAPTEDRYALESQIGALRQELQSAGSVNLEALEELDQLQTRYDTLAGHERDLIEAKASLVKTMQKIDTDSQSLFVETLETIRGNFQNLYRKSFGGGHADIVLDAPEDPESGIEILATPPGKTTFSNNLLSGGEKALTAVSLIMSFFQYRPSPFCVLDEVDAPFDEANIGRFVNVLKEFLDTTRFIIVTHSKKTMTAADRIYGITMQESGVSRQVSVTFEEVDERGQVTRRESKAA